MKTRNIWKAYSYSLMGLAWAAGLMTGLAFGFISALRHLLWIDSMAHHALPPWWLWATIIVLGGALLLFWYRIVGAATRHVAQRRGMMETIKPFLSPLSHPISHGLRQVAQWYTVQDGGERYAFTWGLVRCRVVVSQSLWNALDNSAQTAVLHHEAAHALARDPLQQVFLQVLSDALRPLGMGLLYQRYLIRREINADAMALAACQGDDVPLLQALHAVVDSHSHFASRVGLAGAFEARIQYLETQETPSWLDSHLRGRLFASVAAILLTVGEGWLVWCHW